MGEVGLPREEYTNWLFGAKWSSLKTHIQVTLYGLKGLYLGIYIYINIHVYMCAITVDARRDHEFEGEGCRGRFHGRKEKERLYLNYNIKKQ